MEDLIDIQGLDYIGWWPLALGWWFVIASAVIFAALGIFFLWRKLKYRRSWQFKAYQRLDAIHAELEQINHKQSLQKLSVEMRKIAMLTTKRESCAGLIGNKWLQWLQEHDPTGFAWVDNGALLVSAQYMPDAAREDVEQINKLIAAAQGWVTKC